MAKTKASQKKKVKKAFQNCENLKEKNIEVKVYKKTDSGTSQYFYCFAKQRMGATESALWAVFDLGNPFYTYKGIG